MTGDVLLAFLVFALVMSATPGPNNTMLLASGVNFGFRRSLPHLFGIMTGVMVMFLAVGLGLGSLFEAWPPLHVVMQVLGAGYLLFLAWRLARSGGLSVAGAGARPMSFVGGAGFQLVNPKAWVMVISAVTAYTPQEDYLRNLVIGALLFVAVGIPSCGVWTAFGVVLRRVLQAPGRVKVFNVTMAGLLVLSLIPILLP